MRTQRTNIPSSLQGNVSSIDTATLGIPVANWPADDCSINEFFQPQELVFDITLCGGKCLPLGAWVARYPRRVFVRDTKVWC